MKVNLGSMLLLAAILSVESENITCDKDCLGLEYARQCEGQSIDWELNCWAFASCADTTIVRLC